jgi:hypothetical protein
MAFLDLIWFEIGQLGQQRDIVRCAPSPASRSPGSSLWRTPVSIVTRTCVSSDSPGLHLFPDYLPYICHSLWFLPQALQLTCSQPIFTCNCGNNLYWLMLKLVLMFTSFDPECFSPMGPGQNLRTTLGIGCHLGLRHCHQGTFTQSRNQRSFNKPSVKLVRLSDAKHIMLK